MRININTMHIDIWRQHCKFDIAWINYVKERALSNATVLDIECTVFERDSNLYIYIYMYLCAISYPDISKQNEIIDITY